MAKLVVTEAAQCDIDDVVANVVEYTYFPSSGLKLVTELYEKFELIAFMPEGMGRLRPEGTREAFCRGYRIVYEIMPNNEVHIRTVIHSRRLYPRPE